MRLWILLDHFTMTLGVPERYLSLTKSRCGITLGRSVHGIPNIIIKYFVIFLGSAWEKNQKPDWMLEDIWARLNEKQTTENTKFQKTSIQAKAPVAFNKADSLHISGSAKIGTDQRKSKKRRSKTYDEVIEETCEEKRMVILLWSSHMLRGQMLGIKKAWMNGVKVNLLLRMIAQNNRQTMMKLHYCRRR